MLADQVDYVVGVDTHRDEHVLAVVAARRGRWWRSGRCPRPLAGTRRRSVRRPSTPPACGCGRSRAAGTTEPGSPVILSGRGETVLEAGRWPPATSGGCRARTTRSTRPGRPGPRSPASADSATLRAAAGGAAAAAGRSQERRRCPPRSLVQLRSVIVTAPDRAPRELRGLPTGRLIDALSRFRRASSRTPDEHADEARAAHARPPRPGAHPRSSASSRPRSSITSERSRPAARRARRRPDRRRAADRQPGRTPAASAPKPPSPGSPASPDPASSGNTDPPPAQPRRRPPAQPRPAHRDHPPPLARPRHQGLHRPPQSPKAKPAETPSACSNATSPATSTASSTTRHHDLTA